MYCYQNRYDNLPKCTLCVFPHEMPGQLGLYYIRRFYWKKKIPKWITCFSPTQFNDFVQAHLTNFINSFFVLSTKNLTRSVRSRKLLMSKRVILLFDIMQCNIVKYYKSYKFDTTQRLKKVQTAEIISKNYIYLPMISISHAHWIEPQAWI